MSGNLSTPNSANQSYCVHQTCIQIAWRQHTLHRWFDSLDKWSFQNDYQFFLTMVAMEECFKTAL